MNLDEALQTFFAESCELLEEMERALLRVEQEEDKSDAINAIFRAAHTIKGSAGLFGLDAIVAFTHVLESVLDRIRRGELIMTGELVAHFLASCDHIGALLRQAAAPGSELDAEARASGEKVLAALRAHAGSTGAQPHAPAKSQVRQEPASNPEGSVGSDQWHVSLRFGSDALRHGLDPLGFLRYLGTLGRIVHIETLADAMPEAKDMDPESCYLGFELGFVGEVDKQTIENVFEFVREDCAVQILPPRSLVSAYTKLIRDLPEEERRIGEILIACGTLTSRELDEALKIQASEPTGEGRPIGEILVAEHNVQPDVVDAAIEKQRLVKEKRSQETGFIRVDAVKLDRFINLVGELVIAGAGTALLAQRSGLSELVESASSMSRLVDEVRDSALALRMVQIGATFNRFHRVVRDVSKELGKDIELEISGAETELDKNVVDRIGDPLTHLVRNAMDHGIEAADRRLASGKPARGKVRLNAFHESGCIVIEVSDDGGGLDRERILKKALEKGLVASGRQLGDAEVYALIFEPGFSTAEVVSNLSGRGVGMDVVKRNVDALRGTIDLASKRGQGTTVKITLPLTLAIIDGFAVGVGKGAFIAPLDAVVECIELPKDQNAAASGSYVNLRGEVLPFVRLRDLFEATDPPGPRQSIVVVQYGKRKAGLVVDRLLGEFQTVIKPLNKVFGRVKCISGSTILGTGEVALILDVPALVEAARNREAQELVS